jgi:hypothetical protein
MGAGAGVGVGGGLREAEDYKDNSGNNGLGVGPTGRRGD